MTLRSALVTLTTLLLTTAVSAGPVLRADVTVSAPLVTVGDMFADAGDAAGTALFRAPRPGTSGLVPLKDITTALARVGIVSFDADGQDTVRVTRAAAVVDEATLTGLIAQDLTARGILGAQMSMDTLFATDIEPINAEAVEHPASLVNLRYLPGTGAFTARFAIAGLAAPLDVAGTIELLVEMPHLTANLPAGTLLAPENIVLRPVPLKFAESLGTIRIEDVVGKSLVRQSREGMMLRASDVTTPVLISKNDAVTIYFRKGPMTLTVKGQAVTSGAKGAPVQVLNLMSKRVISATAIAAGAVEVGIDPLAVAGL